VEPACPPLHWLEEDLSIHLLLRITENAPEPELNRELAAYFQSLRPRYQTAILSNGVPGARRIEQERFHFTEMTDLIIYSYEEKTGKPERRMFELTCERLGVQPEEVILFDDIEKAVTEARKFGIHAILFRETAQAITDIQACLQTSAS
jgi:HAD superfamily hydrolase (TIGR01509 family)